MKVIVSIIIKDESDNLSSFINSYERIADTFVIVDTGSSEEELLLYQDIFKNKNIIFSTTKWETYSQARNISLNIVKTKFKNERYIVLFADPDDTLIINSDQIIFNDEYNIFTVNKYDNGLIFPFIWAIDSSIINKYKWKYPVHEIIYPNNDKYDKILLLDDIKIISNHKGCRSKDENVYYKDLILIKNYLINNKHDPRMQYHYLQTLICLKLYDIVEQNWLDIFNIVENDKTFSIWTLMLLARYNINREKVCRLAMKKYYLYIEFYYYLSLSLFDNNECILANSILLQGFKERKTLNSLEENIWDKIKKLKLRNN